MDRFRLMPNYRYYNIEGTSPLTLDKSVGKPLRDYKIYGNSVQDGTPTPENPIEIQSVGDLVTDETDVNYGKYKIPVEVNGKNLFDVERALLYVEEISDYKYTNFKFENGKTYTISCFSNVAHTACWFRVGDTTWSNTYARINLDSVGEKNITFTVPNDDNEYLIRLYNNGSPSKPQYINFFNGTYLSNFQIEYGNGTEYEPYRKDIINIYLDEPLRKIGDYGDYIDFKTGKTNRSITHRVFDGTENWRISSGYIYLSIVGMKASLLGYSTHFEFGDDATVTGNLWFRPVGDVLRVYQKTDNRVFNTVEDWKTFLQEQYTQDTPVEILYIIKTPLETNIDLPAIKSHKGSNIFTVGTDVAPSDIKVQYYK